MESNEPKFKQTEIGLVPKDWDVKELQEVCALIYRYPSFYGMEKFNDGVPVIRGEHILPDGSISANWDDYWFVSEEYSKKFPKTILEKDDIIMSVRGNIGALAFVQREHEGAQISPNVIRIKPDLKKIEPRFVYFALCLRQTRDFILGTSSSSAVPAIRAADIKIARIPLPCRNEQRKIADILSAIDDRVNLNIGINKNLEAIGQTTFKQWFVDFEFPNEEGKPYKSSDGEMAESEKGEIPKGWSTTELKNLGRIVCGKTPPKANKEFFGGNVPFIKIPDMHGRSFIINTEDTLTDEGERYQANKSVPANSICVSCIATVGLVSITTKKSQTNQQINCIIPHEEFFLSYLFYTMKSLRRELEDLGSGGSATLNVNTNTFSNIQLIAPKIELVKEFYRLTAPLLTRLRANLTENQILSQIRDCLLPKLMSGKIRVPVPKENVETQ